MNGEKKLMVLHTTDDWNEAAEIAYRYWRKGRRVGRERVTVWNQHHPDRPVRTANRYLVYEESETRGDRLAPPKFSPRQWEHIAEHYDARCQCPLCKRLERYDRRKALARLDSGAAEEDA